MELNGQTPCRRSTSHDNGVYVVDAFVSVMTKTVQATDRLQTTATYSVTIDSNNAWKITMCAASLLSPEASKSTAEPSGRRKTAAR